MMRFDLENQLTLKNLLLYFNASIDSCFCNIFILKCTKCMKQTNIEEELAPIPDNAGKSAL